MKKADLIIIVPIYKQELSANERFSIEQSCRISENYHFSFVTFSELDKTSYQDYNQPYEFFDKMYFSSINGYSTLLLSTEFYKRFCSYKYMLICQPDAFILKDELESWLNKGFDYVGAPWINPVWPVDKERLKFIFPNNGIVGNGGFSLRKIATAIRVLTWFSYFSNKFKYLDQSRIIHEDIFWSLWVPAFYPFFKIPDTKTALKFAFEANPSVCFEMNNNELPLGCHAFELHEPDFWKQHIPFKNIHN